jgi:hypothetical protein
MCVGGEVNKGKKNYEFKGWIKIIRDGKLLFFI